MNTKKITNLVSIFVVIILVAGVAACEQLQQLVQPSGAHTEGSRVLNVGFYAYFSPVSYSASADPTSEDFNIHLGYEADLLTALEAMEGT